jgi:hypothetical protein
MRRVSDTALRGYFIGWQCRLRQIAMREYGGRPLPGMRPKVTNRSGEVLAAAITVLLIPEQPEASTAFLKFQVQRNNEAEKAQAAAVSYLGSAFYQQPEDFSDEMTAVFGVDSSVARAMMAAKEALLDFEQFAQTFRMFAGVRRLGAKEPTREASLWQARIFNPLIGNDALVLGFRPDWKNAVATPMLQDLGQRAH